ncbi:MAG: metal ABC transporter permease [Dehalococcoidia bacterium]|nr:metal ABC transporter permease [Dehalococcoidia bacterium]
MAIWEYAFMQNAALAGLFGGLACSLVGVFVVTMGLSFIGVCIVHAAFAGALMGVWLGINPLALALVFSLVSTAIIGPLADRGEVNADTSIGFIFSLMIGLAFLFVGLMPGARTEALNLFWGSILTVGRGHLIFMGVVMLMVVSLIVLFFKEIQAVLCHRDVAVAVGIPATAVFYGLLVLTGATVTASLPSIGGLLIYALILNPAAAAYQLTYSLKWMFALSAVFGVGSCWAGLVVSYLLDLPTGAVIVIISSVVFGVAAVLSPKKKAGKWLRAQPTA